MMRTNTPWPGSMRLCGMVALSTVLIGGASCRDPVRAEFDPTLCHQTYEWGNNGCARIVVVIAPTTLPVAQPAYYVRTTRPGENDGVQTVFGYELDPGVFQLELTDYGSAESTPGDTLSVWVTARLVEHRGAQVGVPYPIIGIDSTLVRTRYALVGEKAPVDTVHLTLRAP